MSIGKRSKAQVNKSRPIVFERDGEQCIFVGTIWQRLHPCGMGYGVQHRRGKGMGGSNKADTPDALLTCCNVHNGLIEASSECRAFAERSGIAVRRSVADQWAMSRIPVRYADGWHLLSGDSRFPIPDSAAEAIISEMYDFD